MKEIKWVFVIYSILTAALIMGIGVAIAEESILGILGCIAAIVIVMGMGFKSKKKMRENGEL